VDPEWIYSESGMTILLWDPTIPKRPLKKHVLSVYAEQISNSFEPVLKKSKNPPLKKYLNTV
jgi:hypothetical protein